MNDIHNTRFEITCAEMSVILSEQTLKKPSICSRINCKDLKTDIKDEPCFDCPEADVFVEFESVVGDD